MNEKITEVHLEYGSAQYKGEITTLLDSVTGLVTKLSNKTSTSVSIYAEGKFNTIGMIKLGKIIDTNTRVIDSFEFYTENCEGIKIQMERFVGLGLRFRQFSRNSEQVKGW